VGLFATEDIAPGEILIDLNGEELLAAPTRESLQVGEAQHAVGRDETVAYLNHACEPSAFLDCASLCVTALSPLTAGREITLNYLATELEMSNPFVCHCGSLQCFEKIRGFKYLSLEQRLGLRPILAPYLAKRIVKRVARRRAVKEYVLAGRVAV
jgi:hypothetical protein